MTKELRNKEKWHIVFAWVPRKIQCKTTGKFSWAWLRTIGRKYIVSSCFCLWYKSGQRHVVKYCSKEDALIYLLDNTNEDIEEPNITDLMCQHIKTHNNKKTP